MSWDAGNINILHARSVRKTPTETTQQIAVPHGIPWISGKHQLHTYPTLPYPTYLRENDMYTDIYVSTAPEIKKNTPIIPFYVLVFWLKLNDL